MKPLVRCYWLTNVWTNLQQHELTSRGMVCWAEPAYHIPFSLSANLVSFNAYSNSYHSDQPIIQLALEQILMKVMEKMGQLQKMEGMKTTTAMMVMRGVMRMRTMGMMGMMRMRRRRRKRRRRRMIRTMRTRMMRTMRTRMMGPYMLQSLLMSS